MEVFNILTVHFIWVKNILQHGVSIPKQVIDVFSFQSDFRVKRQKGSFHRLLSNKIKSLMSSLQVAPGVILTVLSRNLYPVILLKKTPSHCCSPVAQGLVI